MRVAIVDTYYPAFQRRFYADNPGLERASYEEQHAALLGTWFGTADSYSFHLQALGHEAHDLLVDVHPLQEAWAREHRKRRLELSLAGRVPGRAGVQVARAVDRRIALDQIAELDPNVVFCHNLDFFTRRELDRLRKDGRLVAGQIASPLPAWTTVEGFDVVYTSFPHFVERIRARGVRSEYLQLAFDERLPALIPESDPQSERVDDVVFVGGVNPAVHPAGTALLERVCERWPVAVYGYGQEALPPDSPILRRYRGEAWGLGMYRMLARAKVALNRHIDVAEGHANNMRLYEATGMGAALLTDRGSNLSDIFEPGVEVEVYDHGDDLIAKVEALLGDDEWRVGIASRGHERTLREHTWEKRIGELARLLEAAR
jgi:spore maturation protein CgeB